jgi:hypothetical protein
VKTDPNRKVGERWRSMAARARGETRLPERVAARLLLRWAPTCMDVVPCHLWQVIRDVVPRRLEFHVDMLVRSDNGIIIQSARWYLKPGLPSS